MRNRKIGKPVVVTTELRGVFFGYLEKHNQDKAIVILKDARNCLYWSSDVKGFMGLAANGPSDQCRIGPRVPRFTVDKVTSVIEMTDEVARKWEAMPWRL